MIVKAKFKEGSVLQDCRFAPYAGDVVFIIDDTILIHNEEIIKDFDVDYYRDVFEIVESVDPSK